MDSLVNLALEFAATANLCFRLVLPLMILCAEHVQYAPPPLWLNAVSTLTRYARHRRLREAREAQPWLRQ